MIPRRAKQKKNQSDMDQSSDKPKEVAAGGSKTDAAFTSDTFSEGVLTRNRTSSITKSSATIVPRPRTRSLSGSSQSDILTPESDKQSPGAASIVKRTSVPAKSDQLVTDNVVKGRRRRRTKAQIAADNAAKEALLEVEKKETNLPVTKKPGRPRGRPKKVRTPVETPSSTVANSPTSSLQNEEPLPPLSTSNQESLESPTGDQQTTKSSNESSYDFDAEQPSIDNVTTLAPTVSMTLLKKEELTFNEDTPLLKGDTTPSPVTEIKTPQSCEDKDAMDVVEEQSKEECEKVTAKTTEQPSMPIGMAEQQGVLEKSSSQIVACSDNASTEDTVDGDSTEQVMEKPDHEEESIESMDISPCKTIPAEVPSDEVPSEKTEQPSAGTPAAESVTAAAEEISSNFPTDNEEMMDTGSTAITTPVEETSVTVCSAGCTTTTLTNAECTFADSFLTTCAVTAVTNTNTNSAGAVASSNASLSGTTDTLKSSTKTVSSSTAAAAAAVPVVSLNISSTATSTAKTANSSNTTKASVSVDTPSSSSCTAVNSIDAETTTPSVVPLDSSSAPMKNDTAKTVIPSNVSSSSVSTTTITSNNKTNDVTISSTSANTASSDSIQSVAPSVVSLEESSLSVANASSAVTSTVVSSTASLSSSVPTTSSTNQSVRSVIPPASLNVSTTAIGTTTVGNALSKISSQVLLHSLSTTASSTSMSSVAKPTVTSASADTTKDVAKLDPLPINLNTSLSVTLPTLSSLLTTPSGHQKLVLPLEKLVLPSNLETSAATTGAFISPPPVSKPGHSCSYVITSMQMKDTDPVSLAVSTMAQITKENSLHSTGSQKIMSTSHGLISSSLPLLESKKPEPINVETKLREIAPKTLGLEFHHLTSDISRSSGVKKPELYEVLSNFKVAAVNRSLGSSESKSSSFGTSTVASIIGQNIGKEKSFDQSASGQAEQQHKPRPIAIKPDGMDILRSAHAAVATSSRGYPAVHPLLPLPAGNKNLMSSLDLFRNVPTTQKQYSAAPNISASVLPHLPGSSIAAFPTQKAPPPLISITDGTNQTVLGSVRVKVIDAPASAHQSSLSSLPAHMKVTRPRPLASQQSSVSAPVVNTSLVSATGSAPAPPTTYSNVSQQQYMPHPLTIGVHASSSNKAPSAADVIGASSAASQPMSTTAVASVTKVKSEYEPAVTSHIPITSSVTDFKSSLECPMCRHPVKNYKALCGHMKMHGGWDKSKFSSLDDYVCLYRSSMAAKAHAQAQESAAHKRTHSAVAATSSTSDSALQPPPSKRHEGDPPQVFTFESNSKMSQESMERRFVNHSAATLDDLCKAAESMRKMGASMGNQSDYLKRRPENIVIPSQYYPSGSGNPPGGESSHQRTPPYTPPPLLSPRPSIFTNTPLTPRSLYWPQRRSSEAPTISESEESMTYTEPKINVGEEYQAELGDCDETKQGVDQDDDFSELVFKPLDNLSRDDEDILDGYFELACSPAVRLGGRNKEYAHHILHKLGGSVKEAVRVLLSGRSLVHKDSFMASYNYSGATKWATKERQRFRRAWRDNHKDFRAIQKIVSSKDMRNVIEYYYTWKKYCMDEYKGRSRHYSMEEELSEDELETINGLTYDSYADRPSGSSTARASSDHHSYSEAGHSFTHPQIQSVLLTSSNSTKPSSDTSPRPDKPTFKCTYPGCTAAYSSIFALNGHIRIHGGSFYPPRGEKKEQVKTEEQLDGSGVPRDADAKSPRNQARSGSSPKRGQTGGFSSKAVPGATSKAHKGKRISTTPHDQDGHYPCRLCGRVFDKVKSRSAHMKSHVVKPGGK